MTLRYLSVECQTFEPYQPPQSAHFILLEKMLTPLYRELLLQKSIAFVFLVREHPSHRLLVPHVFARRRFDAPARQFRGDGMRRHALKEKMENEPHRLRLFGIDHDLSRLFILVQTEETAVCKADLAVRRTLALPPGDVFGNGSALFLRLVTRTLVFVVGRNAGISGNAALFCAVNRRCCELTDCCRNGFYFRHVFPSIFLS